MFKIIVFDLDGTLIDSVNLWLSLFKKVFKKYGVEASDEEIKNTFGKEDKKIISFFVRGEKREEVIDCFMKLKRRKDFINQFHLFPFTKEVLEKIKDRKLKIAVATGNNKIMTEYILSKFDLGGLVDFSICAEEVDNGKPDPEMLIKIAKFFDVDAKDLLHVADAPWDVEMAKRAGAKSGVVLTGVLDRKNAEKIKPDYIFRDIRDVLKVI